MARQKQSDYQAKYDAEHMKQYTVKYPIEIYQKLEQALVDAKLIDKDMNRNRWTTQAIIEKLEREGYLTDQDNE